MKGEGERGHRAALEAVNEALSVTADISDPAAVDAAMERFGRVDVLVDNAGVGTAHPAARETPEQFRAVIEVNLNGTYWAAQAASTASKAGVIHICGLRGDTRCPNRQMAKASSLRVPNIMS